MLRKVILFLSIITVISDGLANGLPEEEKKKACDMVITPSGVEERSAFDYPGNVSVITREDIENSNAKYVYELLRQEPGIVVRDWTHAAKTVSVDMRGFGETARNNVLILVDGRRINEIDMSEADWAQMPLEAVDRVEILRGGGSVLYGDNASAGTINIITRKGEGGPSVKAGYETGSYRYHNYFARVQGSHDLLTWNFLGKRDKTDGYRLNGDYDGYDFMGNVVMKPEDYLRLDLSGGYHKDWYGLPGGLTRSEIDQIGRRGSTTPNDRAKTEGGFLKISPKILLDLLGAGHVLDLDFWGRKRRNNSSFPSQWGQPRRGSQIDSIGGSARYLLNNFFGDVGNKLIVGADFFSAKNRLRTERNVPGFTEQLHITKETFGIFVNDKLELFENFVFSGGFRQEWAEYNFVQWDPVTRHIIKTPKQGAFDLGGEFKYSEKGAIYSRFSRSYRYPATDEYYSTFSGTFNPDLKHQVADTWEIGVKEHSFDLLSVDADFFFMDLDNEIYYDPVTFTNSNYSRTQRKGVEVKLKSKIKKIADLFFSYTFTNAYFAGGSFAGNTVPQVPRHKIIWGITSKPFSWLILNFFSEYVSSQYHISDIGNQRSKLESYMNCSGKITFLYRGFEIFFGANNIFDQQYSEYSSVWGIDFYPAPGRNYEFGISYKFYKF